MAIKIQKTDILEGSWTVENCEFARVRITPSTKPSFYREWKDVKDYFKLLRTFNLLHKKLSEVGSEEKFIVTVKVLGGGIHAQAEAIRHGLSRTLVMRDEDVKNTLKKLGF